MQSKLDKYIEQTKLDNYKAPWWQWVLATPIAYLISIVVWGAWTLPLGLSWSLTLYCGYNWLVTPTLATFGISAPAIAYWVWIVFFFFGGAVRGMFHKVVLAEENKWKEAFEALISRCANAFIFILYMWLLRIIIF